ncbi:hypothetical protein HPB51_025740 [Rhipicephalus microplus]|uniref:Uncharacterized protein n=1 Tax=Rhipicephalus microplus TaxID=6941 RepID=A0A9J6F8R4_RHIMP|nr:hypothetical protein HPB51_025740 [Rhipicephalus microplus]
MAPKAHRPPLKKKLRKCDSAASTAHDLDLSCSEDSEEEVGSSDFDSDSDDSSPQPGPSTRVSNRRGRHNALRGAVADITWSEQSLGARTQVVMRRRVAHLTALVHRRYDEPDDASDTIDQTSDIVDEACKILLAEVLEQQGVTEGISFPDLRDTDSDVQTSQDMSDEAIVALVVEVSPNDSDEDDIESDNTGDPGPTLAGAAYCVSVMRASAEKKGLAEKLAHSIRGVESGPEVRSCAAAVEANLPESSTGDPVLRPTTPATRRSTLPPMSRSPMSPPPAPPSKPAEDLRDAFIASLLAALRGRDSLSQEHPLHDVCLAVLKGQLETNQLTLMEGAKHDKPDDGSTTDNLDYAAAATLPDYRIRLSRCPRTRAQVLRGRHRWAPCHLTGFHRTLAGRLQKTSNTG